MKKLKLLFYTVSVSVFLASCAGKDGAPGAQGPEGNANVQASNWTIASWSFNSAQSFYYAQLTVPQLDAATNSSGAVDVYFSIDGGNSWNAIPYTYVSSTNYFMADAYGVGEVDVYWTCSSGVGSDPNTIFATNVQIKVVCVAPSALKVHPNVNWKNYGEVQRTFNLEN